MFIRSTPRWRKTFLYLVESTRTVKGPRQASLCLGTTLPQSAEEWADVLRRMEDKFFTRGGKHLREAVRAYCNKNGLPLKLAEAVRAGARLHEQRTEEEELESMRRLWESQKQWQREHPEEAEQRAEQMREFRSGLSGSDKVLLAASVLGVSRFTSRDEVQAAFRKLALVHHPDHGGDRVKFSELLEARVTMLSNLATTKQ